MTQNMRQILRFELPAGREQEFILSSLPKAAAIVPGNEMMVEFWAEHGGEFAVIVPRTFLVLPTGATVPPNASHVITTPRSAGGNVLHLYEIYPALTDEQFRARVRMEPAQPGKLEKFRSDKGPYGDLIKDLRAGRLHGTPIEKVKRNE